MNFSDYKNYTFIEPYYTTTTNGTTLTNTIGSATIAYNAEYDIRRLIEDYNTLADKVADLEGRMEVMIELFKKNS